MIIFSRKTNRGRHFFARLGLIFTAAVFALSAGAHAASYMKIEGIKGEATDKDHKDWIIIESFRLTERPTEAKSGAAGAGKVSMGSVTFTKSMAGSNPGLFRQICAGNVPKKVKFYDSKSGKRDAKTKVYSVMKLFAPRCGQARGASGVPTETLTLNFEHIKSRYFKGDKSLKSEAKAASWDKTKSTRE